VQIVIYSVFLWFHFRPWNSTRVFWVKLTPYFIELKYLVGVPINILIIVLLLLYGIFIRKNYNHILFYPKFSRVRDDDFSLLP